MAVLPDRGTKKRGTGCPRRALGSADNVASIYSGFGRQLIDAQEVYNENTVIDGVDVHSYGAFMQGFTGNDGKINVRRHVDVTHYVIMKFARDTAMPYYDRLAELERTFENNLGISARRPNPPKVFTGITAIGVILIVISVIMAVINGTAAEGWEIAVCIGFPVITIPVTVVRGLRYKKRSAACDAAYERARQALDGADGLAG